jgi:cell division protein FtsL
MLLGLAVVVVLTAAVLLTNVFPYRKILAQQQQVADAQEQFETLRAENDRLEAEATALSTDAEIERLARENLGYVRPGELAYVVLEPPATEVQAPPVEPVEPPPEEDTWYQNLWDFLTGKDLVNS